MILGDQGGRGWGYQVVNIGEGRGSPPSKYEENDYLVTPR
jgi:hypothetical protein